METITPIPGRVKVAIRRRTSPFRGGAVITESAGGAQAAAIAAFGTLNNDCSTATQVVNQNQLGPYGTNGSCGYDCSYEQDWNWWADYRATNSNLIAAVNFINMGTAYNNTYGYVQNWLSADLPKYGTALLADLNTANFTDASAQLQNNYNEMNSGFQNVTSFVNRNNQYAGYLQTYATNAHNWIVQNATGIENDLIGKIACGAGDVQNSFNNMFADVSAKFTNMATPFNTVNSDFQAAMKTVELVGGIFLSLQSQSTLVGQNITNAAGEPPNSPLRQMYVNIATNEWNDYVSEANSQLGS